MSEIRPLHQLFGLSWIDFFQGIPIGVEMELDLSLKRQFLDLILILKDPGPLPRRLPDSFEDLAAHNLLTFKSHQETLDMPDQLKEFVRQSIDERLASLPAEELRKRLSVEERLTGLSAEEVLRALPLETVEALARQLKANGHSSESL